MDCIIHYLDAFLIMSQPGSEEYSTSLSCLFHAGVQRAEVAKLVVGKEELEGSTSTFQAGQVQHQSRIKLAVYIAKDVFQGGRGT